MPYSYTGPVDNTVSFDSSQVKGKTAVITGGASGMGEAYVHALTKAGAYVVFGDVAEDLAKKVESDTAPNSKYVKCDVTKWSDQLAMFKAALEHGQNKRIDIVVANAGIGGYDEVFRTETEEPEEPDLRILNINGIGALYTTKLALHYFRKQHQASSSSDDDQLLVLQGSLAGYVELQGALQYGFTKFGLRGVMRSLRQTEGKHNIRVNYIAPWFVKTRIISKEVVQSLEANKAEFATVEDAAKAVMRLACDKSINGHTFGIVPDTWSKPGYIDLDVDDYKEGGLLQKVLNKLNGISHRADFPKEEQED